MPTPPPSFEQDERTAPKLAFWLVLGGVPTVLLNRAVIPALPGSRSNIEVILERTLALGSVTSQLLALAIGLLLVRLVVSSIGAASVGALERLFVLPIGSAVGFLVVAASVGTLDPELHLLLAGVSSVGLAVCARPALRHPSTRSGGILLILVVLASICNASARVVAIRASVDAIARTYVLARWLATAGQVFELASLGWVIIWVIVSRRTQGIVRVSFAVGITTAIAVLAYLGQRQDTTFSQVIAARSLAALAREPGPFGPALAFALFDVLALWLSLGLLLLRNPDSAVPRRAMALILLGGCSLDVPALAGMATAGGLLLAWFTPGSSTPSKRVPHPSIPPTGPIRTDVMEDGH